MGNGIKSRRIFNPMGLTGGITNVLSAGLEEWQDWWCYSPGEEYFVTWEQNIWKFIGTSGASEGTPPTACYIDVEPGTDGSVWELSSIGEVTHVQNTDYRLGGYIFEFTDANIATYFNSATNTLDLISISTYNIYLFSQTAAITIDQIIRNSENYEAYFVFTQDGNTINHSLVGDFPIKTKSAAAVSLDEDDWIVFRSLNGVMNVEVNSSVSSGGGGLVLITDGTVISNITTGASWSTGEYTGSITGLVNNNYYIDTINNIKYEYLNSILMRSSFNNISI